MDNLHFISAAYTLLLLLLAMGGKG